MTRVEGTVEVVSGKEWNGVTLYSFKVEGDEKWYRMGRINPKIAKGDAVQFEERNSNVVPDSLTSSGDIVTTRPSDVPPSTAPSGSVLGAPARTAGGDVGQRMRYQAARRDAANIVVAALHTDALPWAANVAKAKKLDLLTDYVQQITRTLLEQEDSNAG